MSTSAFASASADLPVGTVITWAGNVANIPAGYLLCDGSVQPISTYLALFEVIGENFGANPPANSFFLPDFGGRFARGYTTSSRRDPDISTRTDSQNSSLTYSGVGSLEQDAFQNHTHGYHTFPFNDGNIASGTYWQGGAAQTALVDTSSTGFRASSETRPVNLYLLFLIKYM